MKQPQKIHINQIGTPSLGYISVMEEDKNLPFPVKRVYWTYFTPNHVQRGAHAHRDLEQVIFAVSGIIHFKLENTKGQKFDFSLDKPNHGIYIPNGYWRDIQFSHNAVLLCLASDIYKEEDYIRDYAQFKSI